MTNENKISENWPALPWKEWEPTASTLHMWTQIVGKTRLALTPLQNHWWNVPLYLTARGLDYLRDVLPGRACSISNSTS